MVDPYDLFVRRDQQAERDEDLDAIEARGAWYADLFSRMRNGQADEGQGELLAVVQRFLKAAA